MRTLSSIAAGFSAGSLSLSMSVSSSWAAAVAFSSSWSASAGVSAMREGAADANDKSIVNATSNPTFFSSFPFAIVSPSAFVRWQNSLIFPYLALRGP